MPELSQTHQQMLKGVLQPILEDVENFQHITIQTTRHPPSDEALLYIEVGHGVTADRYVWEQGAKRKHLSTEGALTEIVNYITSGDYTVLCVTFLGDVLIEIQNGKVKIHKGKLEEIASHKGRDFSVTPSGRPHPIDATEAAELLKAIDIMSAEGNIYADKRRKYEQVNQFIRLIDEVFLQKRVAIIDCGCGKSYLTFVLNYYLREKRRINCYFYGLDNDVDIIASCRALQRRLDYRNMEFHVTAIKDFTPPEPIDLVISLHACDTATDDAIGTGIQLEAPFILAVPCCQSELAAQISSTDQPSRHPLWMLTRFGIYKNRLADLLTDTLRTLALETAGYRVTVTEYVSPLATPKNLMILAQKHQKRNTQALKQYTELCQVFNVKPAIERYLQLQA